MGRSHVGVLLRTRVALPAPPALNVDCVVLPLASLFLSSRERLRPQRGHALPLAPRSAFCSRALLLPAKSGGQADKLRGARGRRASSRQARDEGHERLPLTPHRFWGEARAAASLKGPPHQLSHGTTSTRLLQGGLVRFSPRFAKALEALIFPRRPLSGLLRRNRNGFNALLNVFFLGSFIHGEENGHAAFLRVWP